MTEVRDIRTIVVGVDGSEASVEALRQAQGLAGPLSATLVAMASWDVPPVYDGYVAMGINDFDVRAGEILQDRKSTRQNSSHGRISRMPSSA